MRATITGTSFDLEYTGSCEWRLVSDTTEVGCTYDSGVTVELFWVSGAWQLLLSGQLGGNPSQTLYTLTDAVFDCLGTNTLNKFSGEACEDATATVAPG